MDDISGRGAESSHRPPRTAVRWFNTITTWWWCRRHPGPVSRLAGRHPLPLAVTALIPPAIGVYLAGRPPDQALVPTESSVEFREAVLAIAATVRAEAEPSGYGRLWRRHESSVLAQIDADLATWGQRAEVIAAALSLDRPNGLD